MIAAPTSDHLQTALRRFKDFFDELNEAFVEREDLLVQFALALLGRQHVLMTGPPGTAKSQMASLVLGRIIDESTGRSSLFARQFTENTVQTDLVGPINFKTLMESGRTEHFTDEGMLGSVHAFLDEVFDGRDMLLRSTLNILHEREIKQGSAITKGRIECAFMTSNRYISEVLDNARDTLLAFVDRVAFISFVPRGFADPQSLREVVRRHGGGFGRHTPTAYLSVQDLDVLQAAVDMTYVPETVCDAVADLVLMLDSELAQAQRYDPKFQPTRYLSTRTTVHATQVLRSIVVYDKIFGRRDRPLQVEHTDLQWLRYFLLLNGVAKEALPTRVEAETDPRERRQLDIMATEADIFDRCLAKIKRVDAPPRPRVDLSRLEELAREARRSNDPNALESAVRAMLTATESGATDADAAASMLVDTVGELTGLVLRGGLTPDLQQDDALARLGRELTELADAIERASGPGRNLADWLRGRLLGLVDDALQMSVCPSAGTAQLLAGDPKEAALAKRIDERLQETEAVAGLRRQLQAGIGSTPLPIEADGPFAHALARLEDELALLWDARLRATAITMLARAKQIPLVEVLRSLSPTLQRLRADADRYGRLGREGALVQRVTGPRIEPLVARAFATMNGRDRPAVVAQVEAIVADLHKVGLGGVVSPARFVGWVVHGLVRDEVRPEATSITDRASYDAARKAESALSITDTLVRVAVATRARARPGPMGSTDATDAVWQTLRTIDDDAKSRVIEQDLGRIARGVERLESWWRTLTSAASRGEGDPSRDVALLEAVVQSGLLRALRGDAEPLRLVSEIDRLSEVFPEAEARATRLRQRLVDLDTTSTQTLVGLLQRKADAAWSHALQPEPSA